MMEDREEILRRAKSRALYLLGDMARTEKQMREKLHKNYPDEIVEEVIRYLKEYYYIDDLAYALNYVQYKSAAKSRRMICMELQKKGVAKEFIEEACERIEEDSQEELIRRLIAKRGVDVPSASGAELQKLYRYLLGKGFSYEEIRQAVGNSREGPFS